MLLGGEYYSFMPHLEKRNLSLNPDLSSAKRFESLLNIIQLVVWC